MRVDDRHVVCELRQAYLVFEKIPLAELLEVKTNGPVGFLNDANDYNALYRKTCLERGVDPELNWDCNPVSHELAPANGWIHPFVLYQCDFGGKQVLYSLVNVDPDQRKILKEVDLSKLAR